MPKSDPSVDWTYSKGCGCQITFFGESLRHTSRMTCCEHHNKRHQFEWREAFREEAKEWMKKAEEGDL